MPIKNGQKYFENWIQKNVVFTTTQTKYQIFQGQTPWKHHRDKPINTTDNLYNHTTSAGRLGLNAMVINKSSRY